MSLHATMILAALIGLYVWGMWQSIARIRLEDAVAVLKEGIATLQAEIRDYEEGSDIEIDFSLDEEDDE